MSEQRKYAVEMPDPPEQKDCADGQHWYCSHSRVMRYVKDVKAMRDKMQDEIDRLNSRLQHIQDHDKLYELPTGLIIGRSAIKSALECSVNVSNEATGELLRLLEVAESELAAEREKSAKLSADLDSGHTDLFTQQDINAAYRDGKLQGIGLAASVCLNQHFGRFFQRRLNHQYAQAIFRYQAEELMRKNTVQ